ncbi:MAG TPA: hotdog domain-containing protein [Phycisphaerae bacterium]|nr:hotdog domain-containing protein [Phycisphaerae bacterium]HNU46298.1 hotdog domain-containing protein [Phycisphaerae bacterium]
MSSPPKPPSAEPAIRVVTMPRDTNAQGTIFGGFILSLIDQAAYVEALRQSHQRYVTVAVREVEFQQPVFVGDVLSLYASTLRVGTTSIAVRVRVTAARRRAPDTVVPVTEAEVVLVALDDAGRPTPVVPG